MDDTQPSQGTDVDDLRFLWDVPKANLSVTDGSGLSMLSANNTLRLHDSLVNGYHFFSFWRGVAVHVDGELLPWERHVI